MKRIALGVLAWAVCAVSFGQEVTISRADLAQTYLRFEKAIQGKELTPERAKELNQGFDQATLAFFQQKFAEAIEQINAQTLSLQESKLPEDVRKFGLSLRATIDPPVCVAGKSSVPKIRVEQLYPAVAPTDETKLAVAIQFRGDERSEPVVVHAFDQASVAIGYSGEFAMLNQTQKDMPLGKYDVGVIVGGSDFVVTSTWSLVAESLDAVAKANEALLSAVKAETPALKEALAAVRSRNALLSDSPSVENTAQLLFDPVKLADEVKHEIGVLSGGKDPFEKRVGDYWRTFLFGDKSSPIRVYLPGSAKTDGPLPLVVAFHGAGIDENGFMDAYGAGILKKLADEHGFLLVTPLTYDFRGNQIGPMFDALVDVIALDYSIDRKRIYVLGHSMGGGATSLLVSARPDAIAAAACLCGFGGFNADLKSVPRTLVIAAQYDPLANPARLEPLAKSAKERGLLVEYKHIENYGHTIVVGKVMPEVVGWLLGEAGASR